MPVEILVGSVVKQNSKSFGARGGLFGTWEQPSDLLKPPSPPLQFVYCQVCCEPFHKFCLEESERPLEDQLENWCCRRCKFCHVCGRQHQATKVPPNRRETRRAPPPALLPELPSLRSSASERAPGSREAQGLCASAAARWGECLSSRCVPSSSCCPAWGIQRKTKMSRILHPFEGSLFQRFFLLFS